MAELCNSGSHVLRLSRGNQSVACIRSPHWDAPSEVKMTSIYCHFLPRITINGGILVPLLVTCSEVTVIQSSDNPSKMWPARPGCSMENDKSPDTDHFVGGHQAKISQKIHKGDKSLKIWSSQSLNTIIYHLIFWETDGGRCLAWVMPTVVRAELSRHLLASPVIGGRVTWALADTVIIINATQCRAFSHLQLRSKSPGQKKTQFWPQNKWHMWPRSDEAAT